MARIPDEFPTKSLKEGNVGNDTFDHDAYGLITMTTPSGGSDCMFGSDVKHNHRVRIEIRRAEHQRGLSNDWFFGKQRIVEFEMSHAQFAQFITSSGNGSGTPITLRYAPVRDTPQVEMPGIKSVESKMDTFKREIRESAKRQLDSLKAEVDRLGVMLEAGKVSIKDARDIHRNLSIRIGNLPSNMAFIVEQGEEALEKAQVAAKIQIEAYIDHSARRLGLQSLGQLAAIADDPGSVPEKISHN